MTRAVQVEGISKTYGARAALRTVSLAVEPGEMVALLGASGSGKSTLLRLIAGLHGADAGSGAVRVLGSLVQDGGRLAADVRHARSRIGFVFQQFNLVGRSSVLANVLCGTLHRTPLARSLLGLFRRADRAAAFEALRSVGIADQAHMRASQLSGGQQQRAAIARALVQRARVILADEPIASLDPESSRRVMELLAQINHEQRVTVIVSLHQVEYALRYCARTVALRTGEVVYDGPSVSLTPERLRALYGADTDLILGRDPEASPAPASKPAYAPALVGAA
jgi:phosphonate transport system ATP-binding protein